jgi:tetrahydromethanopterin S-methyltransferase subunit A
MNDEYYPWGGEFTTGNPQNCVAIVLLNTTYKPVHNVAIYGPLKTENIGIEKIVANVISNPYIRYLVVCGEEIRGHKSGESLICLNKNGVDKTNRIINAPGAIPYIENIDKHAIKRFQNQIKTVDLIGLTDKEKIDEKIKKCLEKPLPCYGEPHIAIRIISEKVKLDDKRALHSNITIDYLGKIKKRGE